MSSCGQVENPATFPAEPVIPDAFMPRDNWYFKPLQFLYRSFVAVPPKTHTCEVMIEEPTYFVSRYYPRNMYHALLTMYVVGRTSIEGSCRCRWHRFLYHRELGRRRRCYVIPSDTLLLAIADSYSYYQAARSTGMFRGNVVVLDRNPGLETIDDIWRALSLKVHFATQMNPNTCFKKAIFVGSEYVIPGALDGMQAMESCVPRRHFGDPLAFM